MSDNRDEVFAALNAWKNRMDKAADLATRSISTELWTQARKNAHETTNPPQTVNGRLRHNPHIGPRDGEGPNYATGNLYRNIIADTPVRRGFGSYVASVKSGAEYARAVELGSSRWTSGVKYPYMYPARDALISSGKASQIVSGYLRAAMKGA